MRHLVVMLKDPKAGKVKTRLGRDIGMVDAAWWFRHQTADLLRRIEDPRWKLWLAVTPDKAGYQSRIWPSHLPRIAQGGGNLGHRMTRVFRSLPSGPICIIGGDIPDVQTAHIKRAFKALGGNDFTFGPATDGGYWLIGAKNNKSIPAGFLSGVRWSSAHALADSAATVSAKRIAYIDELQDIDTAADLKRISK